jgi:hypothetical protein
MTLLTSLRVLLGAMIAAAVFFAFAFSAQAASCPVTDGGGGDGDSTADGTITISANTTWTPTDGTAWDCTGVDILVTSTSTLTFGSDLANGYIGNVSTDNLQIDSGSSINSDEKGCTNTVTAGTSYGPDASNICGTGGLGVSISQAVNDAGGPGGNHGGIGGTPDTAKTYTHGAAYDDSTAPVKFGNSGVTVTTARSSFGGAGGGVVKVTLTGTLTLNGTITAVGGDGLANDGYNQAGGGGAGGSVYIVMDTLAGSGGAITVAGGDGSADPAGGDPPDGGGGGGGMVALHYDTNSYSGFPTLTLDGGSGPNEATDGAKGSLFLKDTDDNVVQVQHGFVWDDTDHTATTWTFNANADAQTCAAGTTTPSLTATTLTYGGTVVCTPGSLTSFNLSGTTSFTMEDDTSITATDAESTVDLDFAADDDQTWNGLQFFGGERGSFTIDDAISLTLNTGASNTSINANVNWTALTGFNLSASQAISATGLGCSQEDTTTADGWGPDGSNICTVTTAGYGVGNNTNSESNSGAGHGGAGGAGTTEIAGTTYGSSTAPVLFGSSGGASTRTDDIGGTGGGTVRIHVAGNLANAGTISADADSDATGGAGFARWGGGGSGGSIYLSSTGTYSGAGTFSADGGNGADDTSASNDGAGGGGGRVSVSYGKDGSSGALAGFTAGGVAAAGTSPDGGGNDGSVGTLNVSDDYGPLISSSATGDSDTDGKIDQVILTMNEDVSGGTVAGSDFTVTGYTVASASRTADSVITIVLTELSSGDTDATPATSIGGSIDDTSANSTTSGSSTPTDSVSPVVMSVSPTDSATADAADDSIVLTFSEPMVTSFVSGTEYSISPSLTGLSAAFSGGNEIVTISHDDFTCATDYTVTTTEANIDASSGAATVLSIGGPHDGDWTFTSQTCPSTSSTAPSAPRTFGVSDNSGTNTTTESNGSSDGSGHGSNGTDSSPDAPSESVVAGSDYVVTWQSTGSVTTGYANIYVSYDGGETYQMVQAATKNDGSYDLDLPDTYYEDVRVKVALTDLATEVASGQVARFRLGEPPASSSDTDVDTRSFSQPETFASPVTGVEESVEQVQPGSYITSPSFDTVYLITDEGERRPFMDAQTFFTYQDDFDNVLEVSDATLPTLDLGAPVLPQAGVVLVKVESVPKVYAVEDGGVLRWIQTEDTASDLYGADWADYVIDMPATMFPRFEFGDPVEVSTDIAANILIMKPRFRLAAKAGK